MVYGCLTCSCFRCRTCRSAPGARLQSGDLLFFGTPSRVHHVGISLGGTAMVHAPSFGEPVRVGDYRTHGDPISGRYPANSWAGGRIGGIRRELAHIPV
ncbi:C40 family peptidase [Plantactinospora sp. S1510]|uniref:C40 family peptidase n=1 Tax=Plantactinospora alkalitolerans TaxID=2789879 RepID=A0ABS0H1V0_9ACTN|nr:C40 family peptidase [Plantactinospora alkalitolerans]